MESITVKAIAGQSYVGDEFLEDKSILNGIDCQDEFVEYMHDDFKYKLSSGYMDFRYENGELYTYTTYSTKEILTKEELQKLGSYTQGQWSDGIGEGFEQFACDYADDGAEIFVSPWFPGQSLEISQIWEGKEVV